MPKKKIKIEDLTPKIEVNIKIYEPINEILETHRPVFTFTGEILSMKQVTMIEFFLRKELRKYKLQLGAKLKTEKEGGSDAGTNS